MVRGLSAVFIIIALCASCSPEDLSYGRIYSFVLGQKSINYNEEIVSPNPGHTLIVGTKFIVTAPYLHQVLIWNDKDDAFRGTPADVVLGQPNTGEWYPNNGGISNKNFYTPTGVASDGTNLFVSDQYNNRVLVWNTIPTSNFAPADYVLGQLDFTSNQTNQGLASPTSSTLYYPRHLIYAGGKLLVADGYNNRILVWNNPITANNQAADLVVGQPNFITRSTGVTSSKIRGPRGVWTNGTKLLIADPDNYRVLVWDTFPIINGQAANWVLGQTLFTTRTVNLGGLSASSLNFPRGVDSDGTNIVLADNGNNRVLIWSSWPTANKPAADFVLGQPDFVTNTDNFSARAANTISYPIHAQFTADQIIVSDNGRVLYFDRTALANNMNAYEVLGQNGFDEVDFYLTSEGRNISNFSYPTSTTHYKNKFIVSDCEGNRVLIWNTIPKFDQQPADVVIGQPDGTTIKSNNGGVSDKSLSCPWQAVVSATGRLFIADSYNHRILIYNSIPTTNFASADLVLGQPDFTSSSENSGGAVSSSSLYYPYYVSTAGDKLIVTDYSNSRVLIWNSLPTSDNEAADVVLGQALFTTSTCGTSNTALCYPAGAWSDGTKFVLSDIGNCRVLIWNTFPTLNNQAADVVVGQPNFATATCNVSTLYADSVWSSGTDLFVADTYLNRILIWNQTPTINNTSPDRVFGQDDFATESAGGGATKLYYPTSIKKINHHYFITDSFNSRVLAIHENLFP